MKNRFTLGLHHPVLRGHMVQGQSVLPGLAYIDVLMQLFRRQGHDPLAATLRNLTIFRPLVVKADEEAVIEVTWTDAGPQAWQVTVEGSMRRDGAPVGDTLRYATAEMVLEEQPPVFGERVDMDRIKADADTVTDMAQVYARCREQQLVHDGYMQARGTVYRCGTQAVAVCRLDEEALPGATGLLFHPALIDGSAVAMADVSARQAEGAPLYLPIFYESFRASAALQKACIVRMSTETVVANEELAHHTLEFFDESGAKVAELTKLTAKRVRPSAPVTHARVELPRPAPAARPVPSPSPSTGGATAFLQGLLARHLNVAPAAVSVDAGYYELGLSSLGLMEIVQEISDRVGAQLSPILLFEHTTIASLAAHLAQHHAARFEPGAEPHPQEAAAVPVAVHPAAGDPSAALSPEPIAIIGMSGRFPKAESIREFWRNLVDGIDCVEEVPRQRWDWRVMEDERSPSGKPMSRWGGFLSDVDCFDPTFFRISPREAEGMDPQERLFLQECWSAIEDSGHTPESLAPEHGSVERRRVGVFAGVMHHDYSLMASQAQAQGAPVRIGLSVGSVANRVSYSLGFHGPSMVVDTLCSSSLVAVHLAVQSLRRGESKVAIAGGVNLSLSPTKYLTYGKADMLSSDGRCRAFGEGGDGYVSAEGVAAVVLKPLSQARRDGDHVYAVIRGSATNHVGTASGFTVPSPQAQADVIATCLRESETDPRTLSYLEAHGTGTSLGDPIEMAGLALAFGQSTPDKQFCALGSLKSNIGHAESAAGVLGLIKVALQLHERTLVPTLHAGTPNSHIAFAQTPFVLQQRAQPWQRPRIVRDGSESTSPLRAGISSFGATGSNAHVVLEECEPVAMPAATAARPVLVVLSARTEDRLRAVAARLLAHVRDAGASLDLARVAYTLQLGRVPMEVRWACVASSVDELAIRLAAWLEGSQDPLVMLGHVRRGSGGDAAAGDVTSELLEQWVTDGQLAQLGRVWTQGQAIDWRRLHGADAPGRISLPTYPFARERYWLAEPVMPVEGPRPAMLHPLVHRNTSVLSEQRYTSFFSGDEFFLHDHLVPGHKVLPGAAQLEMARSAVCLALELGEERSAELRLEDVAFVSPVIVGAAGLDVHIALSAGSDGAIQYEIYSGEDDGAVIHGQGRARLVQAMPPGKEGVADLVARSDRTISIAGGRLHAGRDNRGIEFVAGELELPESVAATHGDYGLHPSLMDTALQASIGLAPDAEGDKRARLPLGIERLEVLASVPPRAWVVVRPAAGSGPGSAVRKLDLSVTDEAGSVCIRIQGFSSRAASAALHGAASNEPVLFTPEWVQGPATPAPATEWSAWHLVVCGLDAAVVPTERKQAVHWALEGTPVERFTAAARQLLQHLQTVLWDGQQGKVLLQIVLPSDEDDSTLSALHLMLRSASLENPRLVGQVIEVPIGISAPDLEACLHREACTASRRVRYHGGQRHEWRVAECLQAPPAVPLARDGGLYLITGGAGGLGLIFAKALARQARNVSIVLTGRSQLEAARQAEIAEIEACGARIRYRAVDVSDRAAIQALIAEIRTDLGDLHGVIHSAGVLRDSFLLKKTVDELEAVFAPKVRGIVNLDEATAGMALDWFIAFGSDSGVFGSVGQTDYAAANAFMDEYLAARARQVAAGARHGRSLGLNWTLWEEGGMQMLAGKREGLRTLAGIEALQTEAGVQAASMALATGASQVMVLSGDRQRMRLALQQMQSLQAHEEAPAQGTHARSDEAPAGHAEELQARATKYLTRLLSEALKLPSDRIDAQAPLEQYGIDSVLVMELTRVLEGSFGPLSKTLFYEYQSIAALAGYFVQQHRPALVTLLGVRDGAARPPSQPQPTPPATPSLSLRRRTRQVAASPASAAQEIAIIGLSGRYPQARKLEAFWDNLLNARNCIEDIPAERWALE
ncbi:MAG: SDR family NAD(P)-dependent oxidoreductase, partial [Rhizobacter sp.]